MKRYRIVAWGAENLTDLEYETDHYDKEMVRNYPYVQVTLQQAIPRDALDKALAEYHKG